MTATSDALIGAADRILVSDAAGGTRTGAEMHHAVSSLAGALTDRGWAGGTVGHWFTNSIASIEAALAIEWIGATRVSIDPSANPQEAETTWRAAKVDGRLIDRDHDHGDMNQSIVYSGDPVGTSPPVPPVESVDLDKTYLLYPRAVQDGELLSVPISYGNWDATMQLNEDLYRSGDYGEGFGQDECFLTVQQLMHGTGLVGTFPFLRMGLPQVILDRFDVDVVINLIESGAVTATMMVTAMVDRLAHSLEQDPKSLGRLRTLLYGGAPMAPDRLTKAAELIPDALVQIYGRLEGGWPLAILDQSDHQSVCSGDPHLIVASCGRPLEGAGLIVRPSGELAVRSDMVVSSFADTDGWCGLGDVGRMDARGYLFLDGRLDRMINTGYHVYPGEIEELIRAVHGVKDVRVEGQPDPRRGEKVVALIVPQPGDHDDLASVVDQHLRSNIAPYKVPRDYVICDSLA